MVVLLLAWLVVGREQPKMACSPSSLTRPLAPASGRVSPCHYLGDPA
jgi:hypothetical protein